MNPAFPALLIAWTISLGPGAAATHRQMVECTPWSDCVPQGHGIGSLDSRWLRPGQFRFLGYHPSGGIILKTHDGRTIVHIGAYTLWGERP